MLESLHIQNYKLFKSFKIEGIPRILLLGGKNNCGKTSFLEAVFFLLDCLNSAMFMRHLEWRGLSVFENREKSLFAPAFHNFNLDDPMIFEYMISSSKKKLQYKFFPATEHFFDSDSKNIVEIQANPQLNPVNKHLGGVEISFWKEGKKSPKAAILRQETRGLRLINGGLLAKYNHRAIAVFLGSAAHGNMEEDAKIYGELDKTNKTEGLLEALQILEPKLKSLSIIPIGSAPALHGDTGLGQKMPLQLMGQGIGRLTSILLRVSEAKNGIVLIDELETGFHHSILPRIWESIARHAKAGNTQILATTHSRELLAGAVEGIPREMAKDLKYIRIDRKEDGFKRGEYDFEMLKTALESNYAVR